MNLKPQRNITFHPFADGGVLHRTGSHRLWVLNVTAATLWCLMDGQTDQPALARDYGARFNLADAAARQDVAGLLAQFGQWGLLNGGAPANHGRHAVENPPAPPRMPKKIEADISSLERMAFALAGYFYIVRFGDEDLAEDWRTLFRHLVRGAEPAGNTVELTVLKEDTADGQPFFCYENGTGAEGGLARNEIIPGLVYKLFDRSMAGLSHRLLFHAAVVARGRRALLLPAPSGSGKSTLAAALAASGWTYLSDELAVVDPQTLRVEPFALPVGLKDKSMAALADFIPEVEDLPRHIRFDGVGLRYFSPPEAAPDAGLPVAALVFPRYSTDAATTLTELKPLESLERLAPTGSSARPLATRDIAATLQLATRPSYRLEFSGLKDAVDQLDKLFSIGK